MADILTAHAALTPDKIAIVDDRPGCEPCTLTFAQLEAQANRLGNALLHLGVKPGERAVWCGKNSPEVVTGIHALRKTAIGAVPVNYRLTPEEAAYLVADSGAVVAWVDAEMAPLFASIREHTPALREVVVFGGDPLPGQLAADDLLRDATSDPPPEVDLTPEQVIYTSGTTGRPKGAVRHGPGGPEQVGGLVQLLGCNADDIHVTCGPLYHSGPLAFLSLATAFGNTFVVQRNFQPEDWLRLVDRYRVTASFAAPTPIRMVCNLPDDVKERYDRSSMRMLCANAAPWPYALKLAYLRDFPPSSLYEIYGATELGIITVLLPEDQLRKPGSCGRPAPYVEVALFDDDGRRIDEPGTPGELYVRASSVFATYHNAPESFAAEHREDGWHTVGDVAYVDDEGFVYICDRKKDMIITGGMNVYPAEIEAVLESDPRIFEAAVIGLPSEEWGEIVHAVVVRKDPTLTEDDVIAVAREHLAGFKVPRSVAFVDEIPKTGSNKVLKRELRARFAPQ